MKFLQIPLTKLQHNLMALYPAKVQKDSVAYQPESQKIDFLHVLSKFSTIKIGGSVKRATKLSIEFF